MSTYLKRTTSRVFKTLNFRRSTRVVTNEQNTTNNSDQPYNDWMNTFRLNPSDLEENKKEEETKASEADSKESNKVKLLVAAQTESFYKLVLPYMSDKMQKQILRKENKLSKEEENNFLEIMKKHNLCLDDATSMEKFLFECVDSFDYDVYNILFGHDGDQLRAAVRTAKLSKEVLQEFHPVAEEILEFGDEFEMNMRMNAGWQLDHQEEVRNENLERLQLVLINYLHHLGTISEDKVKSFEVILLQECKNFPTYAEDAWEISNFLKAPLPDFLSNMESYKECRKNLEQLMEMFADRITNYICTVFRNCGITAKLDVDWQNILYQTDRFESIISLSDLIGWLKINKPKCYHRLLESYVRGTKALYTVLLKTFFDQCTLEIKQWKVSKSHESSSLISDIPGRFDEVLWFFATVSDKLVRALEQEQNFYFHTVKNDMEDIVQERVEDFIDGEQNEEVGNENRLLFHKIFDVMEDHLEILVDDICKHFPGNILAIYSYVTDQCFNAGNSFSIALVYFKRLEKSLKKRLEKFLVNEKTIYSEMNLKKTLEKGILPVVKRFNDFLTAAEDLLKDCNDRSFIETWYKTLGKSLLAGISNYLNSLKNRDLNSLIIYQNYNQIYVIICEFKFSCLFEMKLYLKKEKETHILRFVTEDWGEHYDNIVSIFHDIYCAVFYDNVDDVSKNPKFESCRLKQIVDNYTLTFFDRCAKRSFRKLEKHLGTSRYTLNTAWKEVEDLFVKQMEFFHMILVNNYSDKNIVFDFSIFDVIQVLRAIQADAFQT